MFTWILENIGTILICIVLLGIVAAVIAGMLRDRKKGKSSCGGNCTHCAMHGTCHSKK